MDSKKGFIIKQLNLRRLPGIPNGLAPYEGFAPTINIIYGPNASGKSSTARAIQQLIWQDSRIGVDLTATASIGDEQWYFEVNNYQHITQVNGVNSNLTGVPAEEVKNHFILSLSELLRSDDNALAEEIQKQVIGGYDLNSAKNNLAFRPNIASISISEYKALKQARKTLTDTKNNHLKLKNEEKTLSHLKKEVDAAREAKNTVDFLSSVKKYNQKKKEREALEASYKKFDPLYERITGGEFTRIEELENEIEQASRGIENSENALKKLHEQVESLNLPEKGIPAEILLELESRCENLSNYKDLINKLENEIAKTNSLQEAQLQIIAENANPDTLIAINIENTLNIDGFLNKALPILARYHLNQARTDKNEQALREIEKPSNDKDDIQNAINALSHWLKVESENKNTNRITMFILIVVSIIAAFLSIFNQEQETLKYIAIGIAVITIIIAVVSLILNSKYKNKELKLRQSDFEKTGIKQAYEWSSGAVTQRLEELFLEKKNVVKYENLAASKKELVNENTEHRRRMESLETERRSYIKNWGEFPELPDFKEEEFISFYWFVKNVSSWQNVFSTYHATIEELKVVREKNKQELEEINAILTKTCQTEKVSDYSSAIAKYNHLKDNSLERRTLLTEISQNQKHIDTHEKNLERFTQKLEELYANLEIDKEDKDFLKECVDRIGEYQEKRAELRTAQELENSQLRELKEFSLYSEESDVMMMGIDEINQEIDQQKIKAEKLEAVQEEIIGIETLVEDKKKGDNLEKALLEKDEALNNLEIKFEENFASITGDLIVDQLKKQSQERNQPQVVTRANEILGSITNFNYTLHVSHHEVDGFSATENKTGRSISLDLLSSGTRVQFLLAVKLAFLETQESDLKLPLIADELLANSDDNRMKLIIEFLANISQSGRQVFYFTAQYDEKRQWERYLEMNNIPFRSYNLGINHSDNIEYDINPISEIGELRKEVPKPSDISYEEYARLIDFKPFDLVNDTLNSLHIYYLLTKADDLYYFLKRDITAWGQLRDFLKYIDKDKIAIREDIDKILSRVTFIEKFQELYSTGRPKRIDRAVLEDSGAVSDTFMDEVVDLMKENDNNPQTLIYLLQDNHVKGFYKSKTEELSSYLIQHGYLSTQEKLMKEEVKIRLNAYIDENEFPIEDADIVLGRFHTQTNQEEE